MFKNTLLACGLAFMLGGCAQSNYSYGTDFATEHVSKIKNGKTTTAELESWFGQPLSKTVLSATQTKWMYIYNKGSTKVQSYLFTAKVEQNGTQKVLDLLVENGVVVNHTFTDGVAPTTNIATN